jgi:hypothetical protein
MPDPEVDKIVSEESRALRRIGGQGIDVARVAVNRAAHRVNRLSRGGVAEMMRYQGTQISTSDAWHEGSTRVVDPVSEEDRERYHFGDLPDELITKVRTEVSFTVPDHTPADTFWEVTGLTMQAARKNPSITSDKLRDALAGQLPMQGRRLGLSDIVALDGAVTIAHYLTAAHFSQKASLQADAAIQKQIGQIGK